VISRFLLALGLAVLMIVSSVGSYIYLGERQSRVTKPPDKPTAAAAPREKAFTLPGTMYLSQSGAIYSLSAGRFHQLTPEDGWTQPALFPDGSSLLAVKRSYAYSDVYVLTRFGQVANQLTSNANQTRNPDTGLNHWSFYPRLSPDQGTLYMSYDEPKYGYDVNMSIWSLPLGGTLRQGHLWTVSNDYTGGDVQPLPLASGVVLYTKYDYGPDGQLISQVWYTYRPGSAGRPLTTPEADCRQPALSPDGHEVAMICTYEKQVSYLVIAPFDGAGFGNLSVLVNDHLVAEPTWAPDGSGIAYLAPGAPDGPFQLWFLPRAAYTAPPPSPAPTPTPGGPYVGPLPSPSPAPPLPPVVPIQMTTNLGFDATSPIAWAP
jgi:Tol biopolymer transport system component